MGGIGDLPPEILVFVAEKITSLKGCIAFAATCKAWKSAASLAKMPLYPAPSPYLMLADENAASLFHSDNYASDDQIFLSSPNRRFFSLLSSKFFQVRFPQDSTIRNYVGAHLGWMLAAEATGIVNLFHPLTGHLIPLPSKASFFRRNPSECPRRRFRKAALSSDPGKNNDSIVMVISNSESDTVAFATLGDKEWTHVGHVTEAAHEDVLFYNGKFYLVNRFSLVFCCDLENQVAELVRAPFLEMETPLSYTDKRYLVELSGYIILVQRIRKQLLYDRLTGKPQDEWDDGYMELEGEGNVQRHYVTVRFCIWRLEPCKDQEHARYHQYEWVELNTLGNKSLFLGDNLSVALSPEDHNGCFKANCIYFTDDYEGNYPRCVGGSSDTGIFDMESKSIEPLFDGCGTSLSPYSPPLWYI